MRREEKAAAADFRVNPHLALVNTGEIPTDGPSYSELLTKAQEDHDLISGLETTVKDQAKKMGRLERELERYAKAEEHPTKEIVGLIERWKRGRNKPTSKAGKQRVKLVKARLGDGYPLTTEEFLPTEPTLELAVDGLCAYPYRVFDRRYRTGKPANLDDDLTAALKDEKHVEAMARLGYEARRNGWVIWDNEETHKTPRQRDNAPGPDTRSDP